MLGHDKDFDPRNVLSDLSARFQSVHPWHRDIKDYDIGLQVTSFFHGFDTIPGLINDDPFRVPAKKNPNPLSHCIVIIYEQDSNRHYALSGLGTPYSPKTVAWSQNVAAEKCQAFQD
jgi:hypothetical protein